MLYRLLKVQHFPNILLRSSSPEILIGPLGWDLWLDWEGFIFCWWGAMKNEETVTLLYSGMFCFYHPFQLSYFQLRHLVGFGLSCSFFLLLLSGAIPRPYIGWLHCGSSRDPGFFPSISHSLSLWLLTAVWNGSLQFQCFSLHASRRCQQEDNHYSTINFRHIGFREQVLEDVWPATHSLDGTLPGANLRTI